MPAVDARGCAPGTDAACSPGKDAARACVPTMGARACMPAMAARVRPSHGRALMRAGDGHARACSAMDERRACLLGNEYTCRHFMDERFQYVQCVETDLSKLERN